MEVSYDVSQATFTKKKKITTLNFEAIIPQNSLLKIFWVEWQPGSVWVQYFIVLQKIIWAKKWEVHAYCDSWQLESPMENHSLKIHYKIEHKVFQTQGLIGVLCCLYL